MAARARTYPWGFTRRFRRRAFGWKSQPAIERVRQAVSEIKEVARRDPGLAAEGAVLFLERVSPALEQVDSSSGALARKYPTKRPEEVLADLVATTPGAEGKWFATAKEVGLFDEAIRLANLTPCEPKTLTRAARDFAERRPEFAVEAGLAALRWLVEGHGYEITGGDVWAAYANTLKAAEKMGRAGEVRQRIRTLLASETYGERFVGRVLSRELGL